MYNHFSGLKTIIVLNLVKCYVIYQTVNITINEGNSICPTALRMSNLTIFIFSICLKVYNPLLDCCSLNINLIFEILRLLNVQKLYCANTAVSQATPHMGRYTLLIDNLVC